MAPGIYTLSQQRKLQIAILGDSDSEDNLALVDSAATVCARRGATILVESTPFGEQVVLSASKISSARYVSFSYPKSGASLDYRASFQSRVLAIESICASADGIVFLGELPLAEEIARLSGKPFSKPGKPENCLSEIGDLINRIIASSIK